MKDIKIKEIETDRLILKIPTMKEQKDLWNILIDEDVNRMYFPTPDRIFNKNNNKVESKCYEVTRDEFYKKNYLINKKKLYISFFYYLL